MNPSKDIDSKFRYVIIASKRAKQLLKGSRPKIKSRSKNLIRVAQEEVKRGYIEYELISPKKDEALEIDEGVLIGEDLVSAVENMAEKGDEGEDAILRGLMSLGMKDESEDDDKADSDEDMDDLDDVDQDEDDSDDFDDSDDTDDFDDEDDSPDEDDEKD